MPILFLDFETYYDNDYSLSKLAPPNYILDPRYETIGCAVRLESDAGSQFIDGPDMPAYLRSLDPARTTAVAFNAMFDCCILAWRYNFVPSRIVCTMRLAVALRGHVLQRHSLAKVGECLGVGHKGTVLESYRGKRRADIVGNYLQWEAYKSYACNDNDMNRGIFEQLMPEFPQGERRIMDRVMRCAMVPKFRVDVLLLEQHLVDLRDERARLLEEAGITDAGELRSTGKFQKLLAERGVEIGYKPSQTDPSRMIPAFSKTDQFMADLLEHEDSAVQALAAARLGVRSTIEETRAERLLSIARLDWPGYCDGNLPVPLKYAAAHTHRLGGDWSINLQNLPTGRGGKTSRLRKSLTAPKGHKVVVADKSQIEARLAAYVCGQENLLHLYREHEDPYCFMASRIFGFAVNKTDHPVQRFIGKTAVLGLGYGCGAERFHAMVVSSARMLGVDISELDIPWDIVAARDIVALYRRTFPQIAQAWKRLDGCLATTWCHGVPAVMQFGPVNIGHGYVEGPGDLRMNYGKPRFDAETQEFLFDYGGRVHKMYGAKMLENIVQFLARTNTMHDALRISDHGYPFQLQSHDELVWIVPDDKVDHCLKTALREMRRPPMWAPDLPLDAEGSFGQSYGDAK